MTGSHLDAATGRDEVAPAGDAKDADSDDDDDDDDNGAGARESRQARAAQSGEATGKGAAGRVEGNEAGAAGAAAAAAAGGREREIDGDGLGGEVKEMERNKLVRTFFRGLLKEWEMDLNVRPDHVKRTVQGKLETKTQKQAKDYMRPLFKLCKQKVMFGVRLIVAGHTRIYIFYTSNVFRSSSLPLLIILYHDCVSDFISGLARRYPQQPRDDDQLHEGGRVCACQRRLLAYCHRKRPVAHRPHDGGHPRALRCVKWTEQRFPVSHNCIPLAGPSIYHILVKGMVHHTL